MKIVITGEVTEKLSECDYEYLFNELDLLGINNIELDYEDEKQIKGEM